MDHCSAASHHGPLARAHQTQVARSLSKAGHENWAGKEPRTWKYHKNIHGKHEKY